MLGGHALSIAIFVLQKTGTLPDIHFTIVAGVMFLVSCGLLVALSLRQGADAARPWPPPAPADPGPDGTGGLKDYRLYSGVLLLLTLALVLLFW